MGVSTNFVTAVTRYLPMHITAAIMSINSKARGTSGCRLCHVSRQAPCRCTHVYSRHGSYNFVPVADFDRNRNNMKMRTVLPTQKPTLAKSVKSN